MKPRRTAPRKATHPPPESTRRSNRARRREALEQAQAPRTPLEFPEPPEEGRYTP